eukprot:TRINITY_DN36891_c0_g1_i1.p1 TRINITY_DN36891_c0_g1~~TRINITY_DN36891_c0_g1_i1.p1  ORF type:complete len:366 (-),score=61.06 TRINITY_DN36891_c0_g1_i1:460-1557(-)
MMTTSEEPGSSIDSRVQATNDDATISKLSCVRLGYVKDEFVQHFVKRPLRRSPVINRGYYSRWAGVRKLVDSFISLPSDVPRDRNGSTTEVLPTRDNGRRECQILSLGAGFDTLFFQLQKEGRAPSCFVEVDFAEVTTRKAAIIAAQSSLHSLLESTDTSKMPIEKGAVHSRRYHLLSADLRDTPSLDTKLAAAGLRADLPTLILTECVLIYMDPQKSRDLIEWAARKFPTSAFVVYEQIRPEDAFGLQMVRNLQSRGCGLLGIEDTPSLDAKERRFLDLGFQRAEALDMNTIYHRCLDPADRRRIERLEMFDEFEEWHIMQEHYCIAIGVNDEMGVLKDFGLHPAPEQPGAGGAMLGKSFLRAD